MAALPDEEKVDPKKNALVERIPRKSKQGKKFKANAIKDNRYLSCMEESYTHQMGGTTCGLVSIINCINSRLIFEELYGEKKENKKNEKNSKWKRKHRALKNAKIPLWLMNEDWLLQNYDKYCQTVSLDTIKDNGLSLNQCSIVAKELGFTNVEKVYCDNNKKESIDTFREKCKSILSNNHQSCLICNYSLVNVCKMDIGHISPIGGYDEKNDKILMFDVLFQLHQYWISVDELWSVMHTKAGEGWRGYFYGDVPVFKL